LCLQSDPKPIICGTIDRDSCVQEDRLPTLCAAAGVPDVVEDVTIGRGRLADLTKAAEVEPESD
jgi:hypothetical protein